jgi:hypothetical protein
MAPILRYVTSSGSKKKEPNYACLSEAKASHSHRMWTEVSSSVPQLKFTTSQGPKRKEPRYVRQSKKPSKSPVREPPPCSPNRFSVERGALSPEPMVYSFIYICWSLQKVLPWYVGKTYGRRPQSPTRTEGLCTMGCSLIPQDDH